MAIQTLFPDGKVPGPSTMYLHELEIQPGAKVTAWDVADVVKKKFPDLIPSDRARLVALAELDRGAKDIAEADWRELATRIQGEGRRLRAANSAADAELPLLGLSYPDGNPAPYKIEAVLEGLFPQLAGDRSIIKGAVKHAIDSARDGASWRPEMWPAAARIMLEDLRAMKPPPKVPLTHRLFMLSREALELAYEDFLASGSFTRPGLAMSSQQLISELVQRDDDLAQRVLAFRRGEPVIKGPEDRAALFDRLTRLTQAERRALRELFDWGFRGGQAPEVGQLLEIMAAPKKAG
jgi:hypothetical protein